MILVTGAYGFIGSKFVKYLNEIGIDDIIVSDYLDNGKQFKNLVGARFKAFVVPDKIIQLIEHGNVTQVFHFGAVSDTTCWDGKLMMARNYQFSVELISTCDYKKIPISYSSSASVYGNGDGPLNLYAYSKYLVDQFVEDIKSDYVQGFRYFNVYSPDNAEWHKGNQASPHYKFKQQALETGRVELFQGSEEFYRDFVHVDSVCHIQYEMSKRKTPGIFDLGSGQRKSFLSVASQIADAYEAKIVWIPFPEHLKGCYQTNTLANMDYF